MQTISILVKGKVQGVFFRKSARDRAIELGVTGQVKNQDDGSVLLIASGEPAQLLALTEWCKKGPPRAVVSSVSTTNLNPQIFQGFEIVR